MARIEEAASQLSAMFDGELSAAECELLSRRLARDEALRARWSRYALVGAALRSEPMAAVSGGFARRVGAAIDQHESAEQAVRAAPSGFRRLRTAALGGTLAAGVAAVAVFALRNEILNRNEILTAYSPTAQRQSAASSRPVAFAGSLASPVTSLRIGGEPDSYVVPPRAFAGGSSVPASLANYVVAHSEYSSLLARPGLISALVSSDSGEVADASQSVVFVDEGSSVAPSAAAAH